MDFMKVLVKFKPRKIRIGIIDTGVDGKHEDLKASYRSIDSKSDQDPLGGTHCAGIIAATTNNQLGIASLSAKHGRNQ